MRSGSSHHNLRRAVDGNGEGEADAMQIFIYDCKRAGRVRTGLKWPIDVAGPQLAAAASVALRGVPNRTMPLCDHRFCET